MGFLRQIFGGRHRRERLEPLYAAIVAAARDPVFYTEGRVPDTLDGRFDMVAALLALVLLRLDGDASDPREETVLLTETFVDDMEAEVRQLGIGDLVVGKHVGRMVGALGGRVGAFRAAQAEGGDLRPAVVRNIFHDRPPSEEAVETVARRLERFRHGLAAVPLACLLDGKLPSP